MIQISHFNIFYPRETTAYVHIKTYMWMFIVTLFIITKLQQSRCPLAGEWINDCTSM